MKKMIIALVAGWIPAFAITGNVFAQTTMLARSAPTARFELKKASDALSKETNELAVINTKAAKHFQKEYKNIPDVRWFAQEKGSIAKFKKSGITYTVYYSQKGNWAGSIKGYTQDKLPEYMRKMVTSSYPEYDITYVRELETIESRGEPTYIVHLEGRKTYKIVRIFNSDMEVWREIKKQP